jgi:integrase
MNSSTAGYARFSLVSSSPPHGGFRRSLRSPKVVGAPHPHAERNDDQVEIGSVTTPEPREHGRRRRKGRQRPIQRKGSPTSRLATNPSAAAVESTPVPSSGPKLAAAREQEMALRGPGRGWHGRPPGWEPPNKGRTYPPEVLTANEIYGLLAACDPDENRPQGIYSVALRNRALIMVGWRAGLRISEALDLLPKDVDLEHGRIRVLHGKRDKSRVVAIDSGAQEIIEQWVAERGRLGFDGSQPLFCSVRGPNPGGRLQSCQIRMLMAQLRARAGIEKRVHFHGLRHTYAAYLIDRGVPLHYIKTMLGHSSLVMTQHYCDHVNPASAVEALRSLDWPAPATPADVPPPGSAKAPDTPPSLSERSETAVLYPVRWD